MDQYVLGRRRARNLARLVSSPGDLLRPHFYSAVETSGGVFQKDTVTNVMETKEFVVNVVPNAVAQPMVQTSAPYDAGVDEFTAAGLTGIASERVRPPRVDGAPISSECTLHSIQPIEDERGRIITSRIVIGRIELIHVVDEIIGEDGRIDPHKLDPAGRIGGQDYCTIGDVYTIPRPTVDSSS